MPVEYEMPELAESVIEGEIVKWLVKEGEHVKQDQPLVEVMTDKVTVEVPSPFEGILLKQVAPEGAVVPICRTARGKSPGENRERPGWRGRALRKRDPRSSWPAARCARDPQTCARAWRRSQSRSRNR